MFQLQWDHGGHTVILQKKNQNPIITKDGYNISEFIDFEDPIENSIAQIIKQAARKSIEQTGDRFNCNNRFNLSYS